jgi:hypothetical protein
MLKYNISWLLFVIFIYGFFSDIVTSSDCPVSMVGWLANNELERTWKEAVAT